MEDLTRPNAVLHDFLPRQTREIVGTAYDERNRFIAMLQRLLINALTAKT